jgi:hypothetical protein
MLIESKRGTVMWRYTVVAMAAFLSPSPSLAGTWAEDLFDGLDKDFGSVPQGPELSHLFSIKNKTESIVAISSIRLSCTRCGGASLAKWQLKPGEETAIVGKMYTSSFVGPKTIWLYVQFSQPRAEEVRLSLRVNSRGDVSFNPDSLAFGRIKRGTGSTMASVITLYGDVRTQITEAYTESKKIQVSVKEVQRTSATVSYQLTAQLPPVLGVGTWWSEIWLKTTRADIPQLRVPLTVTVAPALRAAPAVVSLGQARIGDTVERKVIVRDTIPFAIKEIKGTDGQLDVQVATEGRKAVHILIVRLRAARSGTLDRTIQVFTDLNEEREVTFQTKGEIIP